jgi:hypothetical protein
MRSQSGSSLAIRSRSYLAIVALAVVSGACGSDSATGPSTEVRADLGQAFNEVGLPSISGAIEGIVGLIVPPGSSAGCTYTASSQSFVCPARTESGISLAFSYALLDASGAPQSAFGATTTNSLRTISVITGTLTDLGDSFSIDGRQDMTLSGLLSTKHTLNGTSNIKLSFSSSGTQPLAVTTKVTIANLVVPSGSSTYPVSGTILAEVTEGVTGTDKALMTFNGTSSVTLLFTYSDGTLQHCTMNLARGGEVACTD